MKRPGVTEEPMTALRRSMLWAFGAPATPHVVLNASVDFTAARAYLEGLNQAVGRPKVTIQTLLLGCVGRVLGEFPEANSRVEGGRIVRLDTVGAVVPVNLLGHDGGAKQALGISVVSELQQRSLRQIRESMLAAVEQERRGQASNALFDGLWKIADAVPGRVLRGGLEGLSRVWTRPGVLDQLYKRFPVSTMLSNPGAVFDMPEGMMLRGMALFVPARIALLGTMWATSAVQDEVIPVDGVPQVRPMLPSMFLFDHRLIDGVTAGRMLMRFGAILSDPGAVFGEDGELERVAPGHP